MKKQDLSKLKEKYGTNPVGLKSDYSAHNVANTRHLKRILVWLEEVDYACVTDFRNDIGLSGDQAKDGLRFLEAQGIIKCITVTHGYKKYFLPYKEELIKEKLRLEINMYNLKRARIKNGN